jgi:NitT/TauT family transport system substrate-binding protein
MKTFLVLFVLLVSQSVFAAKVKLALNWKPEPEFGGFYEAERAGEFKKNGLQVEILPGGAGQPVAQMVAAGKAEFGISSGDEVIVSRSHGADIVALFAVYQTSPMGLMVHQSLGLKKIDDVFTNNLTLAMEKGLPYYKFLEKKFGTTKVKIVPYAGGVAPFLHDKKFAQQGFITSEPLVARREGADPQMFLVSDAGYDPYAEVVITSGEYLKKNSDTVKSFLKAIREGWKGYLKDPKPADIVMHGLNKGMDLKTFDESAATQKELIENKETGSGGLGLMTEERWERLVKQLLDLHVVKKDVDPASCFAKVD